MEPFVYLIKLSRNNFLQTMTAEEEAVMGEHLELLYLNRNHRKMRMNLCKMIQQSKVEL